MTILGTSSKWIQCPPLQAILAAVVNQARPGKSMALLDTLGTLYSSVCGTSSAGV